MTGHDDEVRDRAYLEVIASLIRGDARLFGHRIGLAWFGRPHGWTPRELLALADLWADRAGRHHRHWVTVVEHQAATDREHVHRSALALSRYFYVERDEHGQPVKLTPIPGRVEQAGDSYIILEDRRHER